MKNVVILSEAFETMSGKSLFDMRERNKRPGRRIDPATNLFKACRKLQGITGLRMREDTRPEMGWGDFESLLERAGFVKGLSYDEEVLITVPREEKHVIYYNTENGLIVWAYSSDNKSRFGDGELYGMAGIINSNRQVLAKALEGLSFEVSKDGIISFTFPLHMGMLNKINQLAACATFLKKWESDCAYRSVIDKGVEMFKDKTGQLPREAQEILNCRFSKDVIPV